MCFAFLVLVCGLKSKDGIPFAAIHIAFVGRCSQKGKIWALQVVLRYKQSGYIWFCVTPRSQHNLNLLKFSWISSFTASGRCWKTRGFLLTVVGLFLFLWCLEFQSQTLCSKELQRETKKQLPASESLKFFYQKTGECTDYSAQEAPWSNTSQHELCSLSAVKYFNESFVWTQIYMLCLESGFCFFAT